MNEYLYGVDLGGTTVKIGLFDINGNLCEKWEIPTRTENCGELIVGDIAASVNNRTKIGDISVRGIGIGVPGPVGADGIVVGCVNLGWGRKDVASELSRLTGVPVKAGNDANVAALGEHWSGAGKDYDNIVMITLGTGVGGGIVMDGHIVSGRHGAAGEIGHMNLVRPEDVREKCRCGRIGCLEQAASATGIRNLALIMLQETEEESTLRNIQVDDLTAKNVIDHAKAGDPIALKAAYKAMDYIAAASAQIACVIDTEAFIIGGGVSRAGDFLVNGIRERYTARAFFPVRDIPFLLAKLGNDAGITGAARLVL